MTETQATIDEWTISLFGTSPRSTARIAARANEEMAELLTIITSEKQSAEVYIKIAEEIADVIIVLNSLASMLGIDISVAVDNKMQINRNRNWKMDGTGCAQHVPSETIGD